MRLKDTQDRKDVLLVVSLLGCIDQSDLGISILSVNNERDRLIVHSINQQNHHLTIALIGPMMGAGTVDVSCLSSLKVE